MTELTVGRYTTVGGAFPAWDLGLYEWGKNLRKIIHSSVYLLSVDAV